MFLGASDKRVYNWYISMVAAGCMVLYGYDAAVFNTCQNSKNWVAWMDTPSTYKIGLVNTSYNIGGIVSGFFFGGPAADRLGRRAAMGLGCFITVVATFMQVFTPFHKIGVFIGGRVLIGIGQGIALTAGPIYIGELAPPEIRGKIMGFWQLFYSVGSFIAYWIAYATGLHAKKIGEWDWKTVVIFQMMVPIIIMCLLPFLPESPRWYIQNGNQVEKARASLRRVRDTEQEVEDELLTIREAIEFEKELPGNRYQALWKDASVRKRMYIAFIINGGQQLTGQGSLNTYSSAIYKGIFTNASEINLINAINGTCGILFTLNAVWTVDRFGRKPLFIVGGLGMAACMITFAVVGLATPNTYYFPKGVKTVTKSEPIGIALTFLLFLFIFFYKPTWGATTWIWTTEIFSMNVRAQAVGMCSQWQNVAQAVFNQFFPQFLKKAGFSTFFFFAGMNLFLVAFVIFFVPETRRVALEEMDTLFGGVNHVGKGAEVLQVEDAHHATLGDVHDDTVHQAVPVETKL